MIKQSLLYLFLSIVVIVFAKYANLIILYIGMAFAYINVKLAPIFSPTSTGAMIREIVTLIILPITVAAVPALIYRGIKGKTMPHFFELTWFVWLVIVLSKILVH